MGSLKFRVVVCRIRLFPTLISKIKWLGYGLPLKAPSIRFYISDRVEEFRKIGAEVIGASVDSHFTHLAWIKTPRKEGGLGKMNIPLVSDLTKGKADL